MSPADVLANLRIDLTRAANDGDIASCDVLHAHIATVETTLALMEDYANVLEDAGVAEYQTYDAYDHAESALRA